MKSLQPYLTAISARSRMQPYENCRPIGKHRQLGLSPRRAPEIHYDAKVQTSRADLAIITITKVYQQPLKEVACMYTVRPSGPIGVILYTHMGVQCTK